MCFFSSSIVKNGLESIYIEDDQAFQHSDSRGTREEIDQVIKMFVLMMMTMIMIKTLGDELKKKTSYLVTLSLLPLTPTLPRLKVTCLISDKMVF